MHQRFSLPPVDARPGGTQGCSSRTGSGERLARNREQPAAGGWTTLSIAPASVSTQRRKGLKHATDTKVWFITGAGHGMGVAREHGEAIRDRNR